MTQQLSRPVSRPPAVQRRLAMKHESAPFPVNPFPFATVPAEHTALGIGRLPRSGGIALSRCQHRGPLSLEMTR